MSRCRWLSGALWRELRPAPPMSRAELRAFVAVAASWGAIR